MDEQEQETPRRQARRRVCALFDDSVAEGSPRGRRDAALVSVLFGAGVPRATAVGLPLQAYDPTTGILSWRRAGTGPERNGPDGRRHALVRRRAVEGARAALDGWREVRGEAEGPLLCPVGADGRPTREPLTPEDVGRILAERARRAEVRTGSTDALRRLYVSPWWKEVSPAAPAD